MLLTLTDGRGLLLPAIAEFVASLSFDGEQLVDVAYEPSRRSWRWDEFHARAAELRGLRAIIASASRQGVFRLEGNDAETLARKMQLAKGIDPSLALYAAHAYRDQGNRPRINQMVEFMSGDLGLRLFDIALLAGQLHQKTIERELDVRPFLPMLAQSWAIAQAHDVQFPEAIKEIARSVSPNSLWSLYNAEGVLLISKVIQQGKVR